MKNPNNKTNKVLEENVKLQEQAQRIEMVSSLLGKLGLSEAQDTELADELEGMLADFNNNVKKILSKKEAESADEPKEAEGEEEPEVVEAVEVNEAADAEEEAPSQGEFNHLSEVLKDKGFMSSLSNMSKEEVDKIHDALDDYIKTLDEQVTDIAYECVNAAIDAEHKRAKLLKAYLDAKNKTKEMERVLDHTVDRSYISDSWWKWALLFIALAGAGALIGYFASQRGWFEPEQRVIG